MGKMYDEKMTNQDRSQAGLALVDWFESQRITPGNAIEVMCVVMMAFVRTIAKDDKSKAIAGTDIINKMLETLVLDGIDRKRMRDRNG
jgi:hypothetical protein